MLRGTLCLGRDENGYPAKDIDMVPERKSTFVQFLKEQKDKLQEERDSWATRYHKLYKDYTVLKYSYMF